MSDERSTHSAIDESDAADDPDSNGLEPGGGPQRVVSEESVDDILDSLESTSDSAAASEATTTVTESTGSVTTEFDEDDVPAADDVGTDGQPAAPPTDSTPTDSESAVDLEDDAATDTDDDTAPNADGDTTPSDASIDAAAASLPDDTDDASLEDLADRIEDGTVTGADVRAAEAGEGRESTPEIDEVDLSMDDLEATQTGGAGGDDWADDAGPLAGSVDRDGDAGTAADADDDSDDSRGLFARLKGFFSR